MLIDEDDGCVCPYAAPLECACVILLPDFFCVLLTAEIRPLLLTRPAVLLLRIGGSIEFGIAVVFGGGIELKRRGAAEPVDAARRWALLVCMTPAEELVDDDDDPGGFRLLKRSNTEGTVLTSF